MTSRPASGHTHQRVEALAACELSAAIGYAEAYLRERLPATIKVPLTIGGLGIELKRAVAVEAAVAADWTDPVRRHPALQLLAQPVGGLPFPALKLLVTVRPHFPPGTCVTLDLSYVPPLGMAGRLFDAIVGHHVARAIARSTLDELCTYLAGRSLEFAASCTPSRAVASDGGL